jgi:ABC-type ATPase with predicted acetyltransferase domain
MIWVCYACGRRYKVQPDYCQCGSLQFKIAEGDRSQNKSRKNKNN